MPPRSGHASGPRGPPRAHDGARQGQQPALQGEGRRRAHVSGCGRGRSWFWGLLQRDWVAAAAPPRSRSPCSATCSSAECSSSACSSSPAAAARELARSSAAAARASQGRRERRGMVRWLRASDWTMAEREGAAGLLLGLEARAGTEGAGDCASWQAKLPRPELLRGSQRARAACQWSRGQRRGSPPPVNLPHSRRSSYVHEGACTCVRAAPALAQVRVHSDSACCRQHKYAGKACRGVAASSASGPGPLV